MSFYDFYLPALETHSSSPPASTINQPSASHQEPQALATSRASLAHETTPYESSPGSSAEECQGSSSHPAEATASTSQAPETSQSPETSSNEPSHAMESQPQLESAEAVAATQAAIAAKLAEAEQAIHPMAQAIPSLHQAIKINLAQKNIGRHRTWSLSSFKHITTRWRNMLANEKPELVGFLTALAAHEVLRHKEHDAFAVLVEHRRLVAWAEKELRALARREGIDLVKALQGEHPEMALKVKQETDEQEPEAPLQAAVQTSQPATQQQTTPCTPPAPPTLHQQQLLNGVSLRPEPERLHQETTLRMTVPKTVFEQPAEQAQPAAPTGEATQPTFQDQTNREEGSIHPLKRSIECPSGAVCPHEPKKPKTRDFGCQVDLTAPDSRPQQDKPRQETAQPSAKSQPESTYPVAPHARQEDDLITAVKELVQSNVESQQSNRALHQSMQDMAQGMYWQQQQQQRALMPPMSIGMGMYGKMPQIPEYGMMMAPSQLGLQYLGGVRSWGGHQGTQIAMGRGMAREGPRQRSVMPETQRVTKQGREEGGDKHEDSAKDQSRFFW